MVERDGQIAGLFERLGDDPREVADRRPRRRGAGRSDARRATPRNIRTRSKSNASSPPPDVTTSVKLSVSSASDCQSMSSGRSSSAWPMMRSSAPGSSGASSLSVARPVARNRRRGVLVVLVRAAASSSGFFGNLLGDEGFELEVAQLQQLDRLASAGASGPATGFGGCLRTARAPWPPLARARSSRRGRGGGPPGRRPTLRECPGTGPGRRR